MNIFKFFNPTFKGTVDNLKLIEGILNILIEYKIITVEEAEKIVDDARRNKK